MLPVDVQVPPVVLPGSGGVVWPANAGVVSMSTAQPAKTANLMLIPSPLSSLSERNEVRQATLAGRLQDS
jgi:hypothetical protein